MMSPSFRELATPLHDLVISNLIGDLLLKPVKATLPVSPDCKVGKAIRNGAASDATITLGTTPADVLVTTEPITSV